MLFLPIKADFPLPRWPVMTVVVCLICVGVFLLQQRDMREFIGAIERYCHKDRSRIELIVFERIASMKRYEYCDDMMMDIVQNDNGAEVIEDIVTNLRPLAGFSHEDSKEYVRLMLEDEWRTFVNTVPEHPSRKFAYHTDSWNPWGMIRSAFAHGDWGHIIGNLIFFFAFAATVEALAGPVMFWAAILAISIFTGIFSSVSAYATGDHLPTLGLSGVVMGMMGLFSALIPRGRVRCFYWFIVLFGTVAIPAWALTLWFVGMDTVKLFVVEDHGFINVMAHVTGGIGGYLFGIAFMRKARERARDLMFDIDMNTS